jgi:ParB family chromosome partitioning protein
VQKDIAYRIGKSREMVANSLRLLTLPEDIQQAVLKGEITEGHAKAILMVGNDQSKQREVFNSIFLDRLNVRETENRARQVAGKVLNPHSRLVIDPETKEWQNRLQEKFGTKVLVQKRGDRGKIVVEFYSDEELRGILDKLIKEV